MSFFTPTDDFTHRARLYGVPCYFRSDGPDDCVMAGTNVVFDFLLLHVCPWIHWAREQVCAFRDGMDYEPGPWQIQIVGELPKRAKP